MMPDAPLRMIKVVGAIIVVLLQVVLAPYITIGYAMPNLVLAFVLVVALLDPEHPGYAMPFVAGLLFDLFGGGPLGAMAFVCVGMTFVISKAFVLLANDTLFMPLALLVLGCFLSEALYACLLVLCGMDVSFLDALLYRVLPCGAYDTVICLIAYPLLMRALSVKGSRGDISILS